ncbi:MULTISPECIES: MDR/zinc-dependent alcohol dehydrogenase-like family protein [Acetobacter]|uniref:hypothetical protein n=1 Tax=Acetobacter TaxID=434 RepID=UPI0018779AEC|nr:MULTISPECIES: hypothetical protein [Acetobacter]
MISKARNLRATDLVKPTDHTDPIQKVIIEMMGGGVDYSFEAIGRVDVMRAALKRGHKGWGKCTVIGVAGVRPWRVKGCSPLPGMVDEWLAGKFSVDPYIAHNMTHDWINTAFNLLHRGRSFVLSCTINRGKHSPTTCLAKFWPIFRRQTMAN